MSSPVLLFLQLKVCNNKLKWLADFDETQRGLSGKIKWKKRTFQCSERFESQQHLQTNDGKKPQKAKSTGPFRKWFISILSWQFSFSYLAGGAFKVMHWWPVCIDFSYIKAYTLRIVIKRLFSDWLEERLSKGKHFSDLLWLCHYKKCVYL